MAHAPKMMQMSTRLIHLRVPRASPIPDTAKAQRRNHMQNVPKNQAAKVSMVVSPARVFVRYYYLPKVTFRQCANVQTQQARDKRCCSGRSLYSFFGPRESDRSYLSSTIASLLASSALRPPSRTAAMICSVRQRRYFASGTGTSRFASRTMRTRSSHSNCCRNGTQTCSCPAPMLVSTTSGSFREASRHISYVMSCSLTSEILLGFSETS